MTIELTKSVLLWCLLMNFGLLALWFLMFRFAHNWMFALHRRWFQFSPEQFDAAHYTAMANYKVGIILLNLVPWLALLIVT